MQDMLVSSLATQVLDEHAHTLSAKILSLKLFHALLSKSTKKIVLHCSISKMLPLKKFVSHIYIIQTLF